SGFKRNAKQPNEKLQPHFQANKGVVAFRFDGQSNAMAVADLNLSFDAATFVVVAAPFSSSSPFTAFLATNENGKNDYGSGITIDLGPAPGAGMNYVNVEGAGFGGAANLLKQNIPFGNVVSLIVTS